MAAKKSPKPSDASVEAPRSTTKKAAKSPAKKTLLKKTSPSPDEIPASKAVKNSKKKSPIGEISREEIACEAFYVYERRVAQGLPGDPHGDWLEAERILRQR